MVDFQPALPGSPLPEAAPQLKTMMNSWLISLLRAYLGVDANWGNDRLSEDRLPDGPRG